MMLEIYAALMKAGSPALRALLHSRCRGGKEEAGRLGERMGTPGRVRPAGRLAWCHAASVGEAQSALVLIDALLKHAPDLHVLVTTGTVTSAQLMAQRLPPRTLHQYAPLDHPQWVEEFLNHWQPSLALWMESEIWPNMLRAVERRGIPALLVNARLSEKSFRRWRLAPGGMRALLGTFDAILAQSEQDAAAYRALGAGRVIVTDNLKYAADPLPCGEADLEALRRATAGRPLWLYASTHEGEEDLACRLHAALGNKIPGLLTVIVPRHPSRRGRVAAVCEKNGLSFRLRGENRSLPERSDDIYIADTLGELGLFYRLAPLACIGRSFSDDGGGGHNPVEAAQAGCAVLHGPHVQNLAGIYWEMGEKNAALALRDEGDFRIQLENLLTGGAELEALRARGLRFAADKSQVLDRVLAAAAPWLERGTDKACA